MNAPATTLRRFDYTGMQFKPHCVNHLEDSSKAGIAFTRQRLVQAFPPHAGIFGKLGHAASAGNVAQGGGDKGRIVPSLFKARLQVQSHILFGLEVFDGIPPARFQFGHVSPLQLPRQRKRVFDVLFLGGFITPREQDDDFNSNLREIHPVAGPVVNAHFRNTFPDRLAIPEVSKFGAADTGLNALLRHLVAQGIKPSIEIIGRVDGVHDGIVENRIQTVNARKSNKVYEAMPLPAPMPYTCPAAATTAARIGVLNYSRRTNAERRFFTSVAMPPLGGLAGVRLRTPVSLSTGTPILPVPARPIGVGSGITATQGGQHHG